MGKEYGISVGKRLKAYGYNQGVSSNGKWQFFNYIEKVKDQTGQWVPMQKYCIWCTNEETLNLQNGQDVEIESIEKIVPAWNQYKNRAGQDIKERVINITAKIKTAVAQHTNNKGVAGSNFVPPVEETPSFDSFDSFDDDEDFGGFDSDLPDDDEY